ncbi:MAG: hypothetical protein V4473_02870 [Patescibacteria group bacterium]
MKMFLVKFKDTKVEKGRYWIEFAPSKRAIHRSNTSSVKFEVVEVPLGEERSVYLSTLADLTKRRHMPNCTMEKVIAGILRDTVQLIEEGKVHPEYFK